jgi:holo-[acyl-carrier protein] synthase
MIHGIGVDIVEIQRMRDSLRRFEARLSERVLTAAEQVELAQAADPARFLAKRFAAKEAAAKALGTGFRNGLRLRDIGVGHDALGRPELRYAGMAETLRRQFGLTSSHLSLSDETQYAVALVVLET